MVESSVWWGIVIFSHLVRSAFERTGDQALQSDVAQLRVEVRRARELISGYNDVLEACESSTQWLRWANSCLGWLVIILVCGSFWTLAWVRYSRATPPLDITKTADPPVVAEHSTVVVPVVRTGPVRPSTLGKGRPS